MLFVTILVVIATGGDHVEAGTPVAEVEISTPQLTVPGQAHAGS